VRTPFFDSEALERMPASARRSMVEPEPLVDEIMGALANGRRELTYPRHIAAAYLLRHLAPGWARGQVKRNTIGSAGA
jgi:short-subunit dehydrogenase